MILQRCSGRVGRRCASLYRFKCTAEVESEELTSVICHDLNLLNSLGLSNTYYRPESDLTPGLVLGKENGILQLRWADRKKRERPWFINFLQWQRRIKDAQCGNDLLCRAFAFASHSKSQRPDSHVVIDLTAGLGRDSFLLAATGLPVLLVERNPVLYHMLVDGLQRLQASAPNASAAAVAAGKRMFLICADSTSLHTRETLQQLIVDHMQNDSVITSVYLDPMYASGDVGRKSAVKKDSTMLRHLVQDDIVGVEDKEENNRMLLQIALQLVSPSGRVVVKRALSAKALPGVPPTRQLLGSTHRFDIYKR